MVPIDSVQSYVMKFVNDLPLMVSPDSSIELKSIEVVINTNNYVTRRGPPVKQQLFNLLVYIRLWGSRCLIFSFLCGILSTIVCLFVLYPLATKLDVLLLMAYDYTLVSSNFSCLYNKKQWRHSFFISILNILGVQHRYIINYS